MSDQLDHLLEMCECGHTRGRHLYGGGECGGTAPVLAQRNCSCPCFVSIAKRVEKPVKRPVQRQVAMSATASCAWGEGPDVLVVVSKENASSFPWSKHRNDAGSFGLTASEARALATQLIKSAGDAERFDREMAQDRFMRRARKKASK